MKITFTEFNRVNENLYKLFMQASRITIYLYGNNNNRNNVKHIWHINLNRKNLPFASQFLTNFILRHQSMLSLEKIVKRIHLHFSGPWARGTGPKHCVKIIKMKRSSNLVKKIFYYQLSMFSKKNIVKTIHLIFSGPWDWAKTQCKINKNEKFFKFR